MLISCMIRRVVNTNLSKQHLPTSTFLCGLNGNRCNPALVESCMGRKPRESLLAMSSVVCILTSRCNENQNGMFGLLRFSLQRGVRKYTPEAIANRHSQGFSTCSNRTSAGFRIPKVLVHSSVCAYTKVGKSCCLCRVVCAHGASKHCRSISETWCLLLPQF